MQNGWKCGECGRVNAPWRAECPCYGEGRVTIGDPATPWTIPTDGTTADLPAVLPTDMAITYGNTSGGFRGEI